jgi:hypothetical protein
MKNLTTNPPPAVIFSSQIVTLEGVAWVFRSGRPAMLLNEFLQARADLNHQGTKGTKKEVAA